MKKKDSINNKYSINIFYLNSCVNDYKFPESFQDFKEYIISTFNLSQNSIDKLNYSYENKKNFKMKTEEEYKNEISKLKTLNKIKDINVYIEFIENENFEANIKLLVENEIKNATDRIINKLKFKSNKNEELKLQEKSCNICKNYIFGDIYKQVFKVEEKYYCEKCALDIKEPLFIIK